LTDAQTIGAATYCARCAESVLHPDPPFSGFPGSYRLELTAIAPSVSAGSAEEGRTPQWIILVSRDQPDLFEHLTRSFARDDKVEVILDRRMSPATHASSIEERLRLRGVAVVKRPSQ